MIKIKLLLNLFVFTFMWISSAYALTCPPHPPVEKDVSVIFGIHAREFIIDKDENGYFLVLKNPYPNTIWMIYEPLTNTSSIPTAFFLDKWAEYKDGFSLGKPHVVLINQCLVDKDCKEPPVTFTLTSPTKLCENTWRFEIPVHPAHLKKHIIEDGVLVVYLRKKYSDTRHMPFVELVN